MTENLTWDRRADAALHTSPPPPHGRRRRRLIQLVIVAGVIVLLLSAATAVRLALTHDGADTQTLSERVDRVEVRTDNGDIEVVAAAPGAPTTVTSTTRSIGEPPVKITVDDGTLLATGDCPTGLLAPPCETDFVITAPAGAVVLAVAGVGDVTVKDLTGPVTVSTEVGDVTASNVVGELTAASTTGDVLGSELVAQQVSATSDTGDVELTFLAAPLQVRATTDTGDVEITVPEDGVEYRADARTESGGGTVAVPVASRSSRSLLGQTETGDVSIGTAG